MERYVTSNEVYAAVLSRTAPSRSLEPRCEVACRAAIDTGSKGVVGATDAVPVGELGAGRTGDVSGGVVPGGAAGVHAVSRTAVSATAKSRRVHLT
ncbi:WD repeat-containing protein [Nocardioides sp. CF8]|nr:WD repeat-containing protein [Nocardioides sp. CF8]